MTVQVGLCQAWLETPKTGFLVSWLNNLLTGVVTVLHVVMFYVPLIYMYVPQLKIFAYDDD